MPDKKLKAKTTVSKIKNPKAKKPVSTKAAKKPPVTSQPISKSAPKTTAQTKTITAKPTGLTVRVYDIAGKSTGTTNLPEKTFGSKVNKALIAQALHIYFSNATPHAGHTKTRGEVRGGGKKPWRQKGTGNARAGSRRSPLWVGGGITFGPRKRDAGLELPKKMKKAALISALSSKAQDGSIRIISNLEKIQPKTKNMADLFSKVEAENPVLVILGERSKSTDLAIRNIPNASVELVSNLNAYLIWKNKNLLISKDALEKFA